MYMCVTQMRQMCVSKGLCIGYITLQTQFASNEASIDVYVCQNELM